jgi:hypothetical protein
LFLRHESKLLSSDTNFNYVFSYQARPILPGIVAVFEAYCNLKDPIMAIARSLPFKDLQVNRRHRLLIYSIYFIIIIKYINNLCNIY